MHRRYQHINIPTEIVRTMVVIAETGSLSKAGEKLELSQPAISAQMKRLQLLVGGSIFERVTGGVEFTPKGKLVLAHARKLLEANDQILSIGGAVNDSQSVRLGLAPVFAEQFLRSWAAAGPDRAQVYIYSDHSRQLAKALAEGYVDVACLANPAAEAGAAVLEWSEDTVWVRNRDFVLRHGNPIPLVGGSGGSPDQPMIDALEKAGLAYRVAFAGADHHARLAAVAAGIGLMGLPARQVAEPLVVAREYYLPALAPLRAGVFVGRAARSTAVAPVVAMLRALAPPRRPDELIA